MKLKRPRRGRLAFAALLLAAVFAAAIRLSMAAVGWWMDYSEEPSQSDAVVVLGGGFERPIYAAALYRRGLAPGVWLSRQTRPSGEMLAASMGIAIPAEQDINRALLLKNGVPEKAVHFYGRAVNSTIDEALAFGREFPPAGKKILVVTSRYHARRARMVFRRYLPGADIRVAAPPAQEDYRRWWTSKETATCVVLEIARTVYFLLGGKFVSAGA